MCLSSGIVFKDRMCLSSGIIFKDGMCRVLALSSRTECVYVLALSSRMECVKVLALSTRTEYVCPLVLRPKASRTLFSLFPIYVFQCSQGNIRVFCRVRPLLGEELAHSDGVIHHMNFPDLDGRVMELDRLTEMSMNEVSFYLMS